MSKSDVITKRLHISGLTSQISETDLKARFSSFGNLKAFDGFGNLDALGQPRPYAFLTLETTKPQLARCLNLLSGTMWKGAKLRIGEAKPDFRERKENDTANDSQGRPMKRRRLARGVQGVHAADMSLVTPTSLRPGWRVTPLGRIVRPIRMRPLRPLPESVSLSAYKTGGKEKRRKATKSTMLVRARRRKIDPEEWGSTYQSGIMLESGNGVILPENGAEAGEGSYGLESLMNQQEVRTRPGSGPNHLSSPSLSPSPQVPASPQIACSDKGDFAPPNDLPHATRLQTGDDFDLVQEKTRTLALLNSLFRSVADGDDDDWGGPESLSDLDIDISQHQQLPVDSAATMNQPNRGDDIEYVPRAVPVKAAKMTDEERPEEPGEETLEPYNDIMHEEQVAQAPAPPVVQVSKLKDMFAPRPEDAGFSILGNLDLELDDDLPAISAPPPIPQPSESQESFPNVSAGTSGQSSFILDPKRPFFFPHSLIPNSSLAIRPGDPRDIFSHKVNFYRTESDEEIRARWESRKVDLTRDWKRRHREAVKSARRRGGTQD